MENSKKQHNKHNSPSVTDWNLYLINLWKEYGHTADLTPDLTVRDLDIFHQRNWKSEFT